MDRRANGGGANSTKYGGDGEEDRGLHRALEKVLRSVHGQGSVPCCVT